MRYKYIVLMLCIAIIAIMFTGCVPGDGSYNKQHKAGFLSGIWHGWLAPISLIVGLFDKNIRVYECVNTGWWYDFGFYVAIISGFGGISLTRRKGKKF